MRCKNAKTRQFSLRAILLNIYLHQWERALDLAERYAPERVSNLMAVGGVQQVMLKVRFAEMQRNVSKSLSSSLGINGSIFGGDTGTNGGSGTLNNQPALGNALAGNIPDVNENVGAVLFGFNAGINLHLLHHRARKPNGPIEEVLEHSITFSFLS